MSCCLREMCDTGLFAAPGLSQAGDAWTCPACGQTWVYADGARKIEEGMWFPDRTEKKL